MKIPEKELRKIVRAQILAERFDVELIPAARISQCKLEIPPEYSLNQLTLAANDAMAIYGIPGSFCDVINSLIPASKKKGSSTGSPGGSVGNPGEASPERIVLLSSVSEAIGDLNVIFIQGVDSSNPKPDQVDNARQDYNERLSELERQAFETNPRDVANFIVDRTFDGFGDKSDIKSKLSSAGGDNVKKIKALISEAKLLMKTQATKEITIVRGNAIDSQAKSKLDEYQVIVDRTI